jgi:tetratricopeptide (TPR) repeat protein
MTEHLEQALRRDPDDARANLRMAAMQLRRFDLLQRSAKNPMGLSQIRDAALASRFPSREAQDRWLAVAVGQHRKHLDLALFHARRALKLCPLQGEGYVYLAELAFLDGPAASAKAAYIDQALRVRPHSGEVLLAAGAEAALAGDTAKALDFWKRAFHQGPEYQLRLVELLAPQAPASFFLAGFHPDLGGMRLLFRHYQQMGRAEDLRTLGPPLAQMLERDARAETGQTAADLWAEAAWVRRGLGDSAGAIACAARVVQSAPRDYAAHRLLATWLSEDQQYADAAEQLHWCLHRKPNDEQLIAELATANRKRLEPAPPRR